MVKMSAMFLAIRHSYLDGGGYLHMYGYITSSSCILYVILLQTHMQQ